MDLDVDIENIWFFYEEEQIQENMLFVVELAI